MVPNRISVRGTYEKKPPPDEFEVRVIELSLISQKHYPKRRVAFDERLKTWETIDFGIGGGRSNGKRIIMVDEAHKILVDPDAGDVLAQVVRTARKRGGGVWMASQSVRDFISTDDSAHSPRPGEVLATVASTKLILGVEEAVASGLQRTFQLTDRELRDELLDSVG